MMDTLRVELNEFLPLRDVVFNTLRKAIITGHFKPGERLLEVHLAAQLGVSRTPIREAIRKLELEGLVTMGRHRGAVVAEMTIKNMRDVLEVRRTLDMLSVELACERIKDDEMEKLEDARDAFVAALKTGDTAMMAAADVSFHDIIVEATGNLRLKQLLNNLAEQMYRYRFIYLQDDIRHDMLVTEHEAIYEAIKAKNNEAAAAAAKAHIDNQEISIIKHIEN